MFGLPILQKKKKRKEKKKKKEKEKEKKRKIKKKKEKEKLVSKITTSAKTHQEICNLVPLLSHLECTTLYATIRCALFHFKYGTQNLLVYHKCVIHSTHYPALKAQFCDLQLCL